MRVPRERAVQTLALVRKGCEVEDVSCRNIVAILRI